MDLKEVIIWLSKHDAKFINARRLAQQFNITTHLAGKILRELRKLGYVSVYRKRRGRFTIYKVERFKAN